MADRKADQISVAVLVGCILTAAVYLWGCSQKSAEDDFLVRVGGSTISVAEFKLYVESAAEEAFLGEQDVNAVIRNDLRMRVLNQLSEELIISEHARTVGVSVSQAELDQTVAAIKADYPDNTFEETLLEGAITFQSWKRKLGRRMLVEKVIAKELVDRVEITPEDVSAYYQSYYPQGPPEGESTESINLKIVKHLRRQKAEKMYRNWIVTLRKKFPVTVNQQEWNRMIQTD